MKAENLLKSLERIWDSNVLEESERELIREGLESPDELVVAEAIELVGAYQLSDQRTQLEKHLQCGSSLVKRYAMQGLAELAGLSSVLSLCDYGLDQDDSVRILFLTIRYLKLKEENDLQALRSLLIREDCDYRAQYVFFHFVKDIDSLQEYPGVEAILRDLLPATEPNSGIHRDIREFLDQRDTV